MAIERIVGNKPLNLSLFRLAMIHSSIAKADNGYKESNDRLEYLGDAVLGLVTAEFLFKKYPYKPEGFLTEIRARLVNRESLNNLAKKIGVPEIVAYNDRRKNSLSYKSLYGDTLEALVGAVYLDRGYSFCRRFIIKKLVKPHFDIDDIVRNNPNYKSKIIEWAHKENKAVKFEIVEVKGKNHSKEFIAEVVINDKPVGRGAGFSKKRAEQDAAEKSCAILKVQ